MQTRFLAFLMAFIFGTTGLCAQNLLKNGQFSEGIKHWKVLLEETAASPIKAHVVKKGATEHGLADNYVGTNFVELDAHTAIRQTVKTKEAEEYLLVFAFAHRPNAGDKQLIISIDGKPLYTHKIENNAQSGTFQYKHVKYTAIGKQATIEFNVVSLNGDENIGVLLTDVLFNLEEAVDLKLFYKY